MNAFSCRRHRRNSSRCQGRRLGGRHGQQGVILLFALIALVLMLIGTAALVRSGANSMFAAGNFGFKRDLTNQAERAMNAVLDQVQGTGGLATEANREANNTARNYSAVLLAQNAQGIPNVLLTEDAATFAAVGVATNDIVLSDQGVTVRYVVDRMCTATGAADASRCTVADDKVPMGASSSELLNPMDGSAGGASGISPQVVYRLSIRVTGPRGTQSYFQTTFTT